jgi:hypothetical protein
MWCNHGHGRQAHGVFQSQSSPESHVFHLDMVQLSRNTATAALSRSAVVAKAGNDDTAPELQSNSIHLESRKGILCGYTEATKMKRGLSF